MKLPLLLTRLLAIAVFAAAPVAAVSAETVLHYTDHEPYGNMRTRAIKDIFFSEIEKESAGRLRIEAHWNGERSTSYNALRTVQEGIDADLAVVVPEYTPEQLPFHQLFKSFPLGPDRGEKQVQFFDRVFSEIPEFNAELERNSLVNLQFFLGYPAAFFSTTPHQNLSALQGTTWRTASFWHQAFLENAGAKVVKMPWNEQIALALKDRALDGLLVNLDSGYDIRAHQTAKFIQYSPQLWLGHVYLLTINKTRWEQLSDADRAAIRRAAATMQKALGPLLDSSLDTMIKTMRKEGAQIEKLTPAQLQNWLRATHFSQEQKKWIGKQEKSGIADTGRVLPLVASRLDGVMH
ncbi:TRAP transporter substrate-binding protein DctP [Klebsiella spallanzanii]|uniref:ABC transporter substrate-binding protein n=1 Tax=Klebsiella spallanzanii TaxID=2587528 RepID=A0A564ICH2_9ENTR|nr:TRAP transporter substrate-binding protein DctP [Klebsiella spallanzanii]VUS43266.1 hypothetical protein SB6408_03688 [Klebsiella spallanzanii]